MLLNGKIDDDPESESPDEASGIYIPPFTLAVALFSLALYIAFEFFGHIGRGNAASCMAIAIVFTVHSQWGYRTRIWFWVTVALITLLHGFLVFVVPWPNKDHHFPVIYPLGLADCGFILLCVKFVAKLVKSPPPLKDDDGTQ